MDSAISTLYPLAYSCKACPICIEIFRKTGYRDRDRDYTRTVTMTIRGTGMRSSFCSLEMRSLSCLGLPSIKYPRNNLPSRGDWNRNLFVVFSWKKMKRQDMESQKNIQRDPLLRGGNDDLS